MRRKKVWRRIGRFLLMVRRLLQLQHVTPVNAGYSRI